MKEYAALGLLAWFQNMIPALLPFMIFTNLILNLNLEEVILKPLYLILEPFFKVRREMLFAICIGFLCGFPMGSKVLSDLYRKGKISHVEAEYLLCFTNNIGPAYYLGFVCPVLLPEYRLSFLLFVQFGIPFCYGLFLRNINYKNKIHFPCTATCITPILSDTASARLSSPSVRHPSDRITIRRFAYALDDAINNGLIQIGALGGYMILFNVLVWFPHFLLKDHPVPALFCHMSIEITGGLTEFARLLSSGQISISDRLLPVQSMLCLNGLCCLFQTIKFLKGTDLSIKKYMLHKIILCSITVLFLTLSVI